MFAIGQNSILAAVIGTIFIASGTAVAQSADELRLEVEQLRGEVRQLRQRVHGDELTVRQAQQVKQLISEVLADADTRASLLDQSVHAGYDNGFYIASADGKNKLKVRGMVQFRYILGHHDNAPGDDTTSGFELSRTRYGFMGHIHDPSWQYKIWAGYGRTGGTLLLDAFVTKKIDDNWSVTAGQFKLPVFKEWLVSETALQVIERSIIAPMCVDVYTQGIKVDYKDDMFHATASVNDGMRGALNSSWEADAVDWSASARVEWLAFGSWKQYGDLESWRGEEPMLVIGLAGHIESGDRGTTADETDRAAWTADASLELGGGNIFVAVVGRETDSTTEGDFLGTLVQGGYFITDQFEMYGRWEHLSSDLNLTSDLDIITVGGNYFFKKHQIKLSGDIGFALNEVSDAYDSNARGYRIDGAGESGQVVVRLQMQLLF